MGESQEILDYLIAKIKSIELDNKPFPHFKIENFLPEKFYDQLMETFPGDEYFEHAVTSSIGRKIIQTDKNQSNFKLLEQHSCWKILQEVTHTKLFQQSLLEVFEQSLKQTACKCSKEGNFSTQLDISRAGAGYQRGPHLDRRNHVINTFFYLNSNASFEGQGGDLQLLSPKDPDMLLLPDKFPDENEMDVIKSLPTRENSFVAFLPCSYSWHSVTELTHANGYRKFVYVSVNTEDYEDAWPQTYVQNSERREAFLAE